MRKVQKKDHSKSSIRVFSGLSSFQMLAMFRRGLFYTYLSIYMRDFLNLSVTITTLYASIPMFMSVIFQNFVWGPISDRIQRRRTLIVCGEILAGIGTIIVWGIHSIFNNFIIAGWVIIIGLSFIEMFWSMSNIGWSALVSDLYPSEKRSKIMGQLTSLGGLGRIFGIFIGGFLYDSGFGFRNGPLFFVASFVMFISTIPMLFAPEGGIDSDISIKEDSQELERNNQKNIAIFVVFIIALIFINFGRNSIAVPYSQYLSLDSGFNVDSIMLSFIANTRSVATMLIGFTAGVLSKKIGHARALILGASIGIIALIVTATTTLLGLMFLGSFLLGASEVIIYAASYAIASILIPARMRAKLFAIYNTTFFLSWGVTSTLVSGPLIDFLISQGKSEAFSYQVSFIVGALMCFIGVIIFIFLEIRLKAQDIIN